MKFSLRMNKFWFKIICLGVNPIKEIYLQKDKISFELLEDASIHFIQNYLFICQVLWDFYFKD